MTKFDLTHTIKSFYFINHTPSNPNPHISDIFSKHNIKPSSNDKFKMIFYPIPSDPILFQKLTLDLFQLSTLQPHLQPYTI
jgi:hypothetical protein